MLAEGRAGDICVWNYELGQVLALYDPKEGEPSIACYHRCLSLSSNSEWKHEGLRCALSCICCGFLQSHPCQVVWNVHHTGLILAGIVVPSQPGQRPRITIRKVPRASVEDRIFLPVMLRQTVFKLRRGRTGRYCAFHTLSCPFVVCLTTRQLPRLASIHERSDIELQYHVYICMIYCFIHPPSAHWRIGNCGIVGTMSLVRMEPGRMEPGKNGV
jgi:hypothetical protein